MYLSPIYSCMKIICDVMSYESRHLNLAPREGQCVQSSFLYCIEIIHLCRMSILRRYICSGQSDAQKLSRISCLLIYSNLLFEEITFQIADAKCSDPHQPLASS